MRYLSICSGIEAASVAWHPLGWTPAGFSEIEAFPRSVLQHRFGAQPVDWDHRHTPQSNMISLFGDFTKIEAHHVGPIDLLVGGTPCQSFSVAGKRLGLDDPRGHLTLEYLALARRLRPRWLVWENVPGVLSDDGGRTLGTFLTLLGELGYRWAYRVLDAQYCRVGGFGRAVPQRRRRVFVVGYLGDDARAAAVLFDRKSLRADPAPRREAGQNSAPALAARTRGGGGLGTDFDCDGGLVCREVSPALKARDFKGVSSDGDGDGDGDGAPLIAHALRGEGFDASEDGTGRGTPLVPVCFDTTQITSAANYSNPQPGGPCHPLAATAHAPSIAFAAETWAVRRLTPRECERLQGFPDDWTQVPHRGKPAADGPRYKAIGNSMAVNVMRWIGERIAAVDTLTAQEAQAA
jgi:DNA (cytosine-5)-methyltransferase 1